jgi:hypothetical protein
MWPISKEFRLLYWAILGVIVPFGLLLYFFPGGTELYWAWVIPHPRSSILIGAGYVGAIAYYTLLLRENDWHQARNGMGGLIIFCIVLLIATLLHWEEFRTYHITTLVWLIFYYVGPFLVPILYRLQTQRTAAQSSTTPASDADGRSSIALGWKVWQAARGFFYLALALFWLVSADTVSTAWPWPIHALELRVFMGQVAIIGWNAVVVLQEGRQWQQFRLGQILTGAIGFMQLIGLFISTTTYSWSIGLGIFLPLMFGEWIITPLLLLQKYERAKR